jgi:putative ABC transport system substrate-binding protein
MRRRHFIGALGWAATSAWPGVARPQPASPGGLPPRTSNAPVVGFLNSASPATYRFNSDSFREGLAQAGFVHGRNVRIEERWANSNYAALPTLAAELVAKGVVAIAATGDVASARAAKGATTTVPVVFTIGGDPVRFGLVASFNHPGGNVTGIMFVPSLLGSKRVQLLHDLAPNVTRIALLMNPDNANAAAEQADTEAGAARLGRQTMAFNARNAAEIDAAFADLVRARADAVISPTDPVLLDRREQVVALAERHALPAVSFTRTFAAAGGLMSYGPQHYVDVPPGRRLHRTDPQGRATGRHARHAVDEHRAGAQPQDREAPGADGAADLSCVGQRSARVTGASGPLPFTRAWAPRGGQVTDAA